MMLLRGIYEKNNHKIIMSIREYTGITILLIGIIPEVLQKNIAI
jgi:hypothetical protein